MAATAPSANRWLHGPALDLLLGCGGLYLVSLFVFAYFGSDLPASKPSFLIPLLMVAVSMPHYGATLVRVYERRVDRRGYAIFSIWTTIALLGAFALSLNHVYFGSIVMTVYLTWSPWHYTGQNYGISVMLLRRRGVDISPLAKRLLYVSFLSSFLLVFVIFHSSSSAPNYGAVSSEGTDYRFLQLGIPLPITMVVFYVLGVVYAGSLIAAFALMRRRAASFGDLGPAALMALTQAVWFAIPYALATHGLRTGFAPLDDYFGIRDYVFWVALGHAVQYLWVTSYYARNSPAWHGYPQYFGKAMASGVAVWTLPVIFFAPDLFGSRSYNAGLALMVASFVNIHHFILDGAIWKLRSTRIAGVLIRPTTAEAVEPGEGPSWARRGVWATAVAALAVAVFVLWEKEFRYPRVFAAGDYAGASAVLDRMIWLGRDNIENRRNIAISAARSGDPELALHQYDRILAIAPSAQAFAEMGTIHRIQKDWPQALAAFERGVEEDPEHLQSLYGLAVISMELGDFERAVASLEKVHELDPNDAGTRAQLERARSLAAERSGSS